MSIRSEKVAAEVQKTLAAPVASLAEEFGAGLATITSVKMSPDLQIAKVYLSLYGKNYSIGDFIKRLEARSGELRSFVGSKVRLRRSPELRFYPDDTLDQMDRIRELIEEAKTSRPPAKFNPDDYDDLPEI